MIKFKVNQALYYRAGGAISWRSLEMQLRKNIPGVVFERSQETDGVVLDITGSNAALGAAADSVNSAMLMAYNPLRVFGVEAITVLKAAESIEVAVPDR